MKKIISIILLVTALTLITACEKKETSKDYAKSYPNFTESQIQQLIEYSNNITMQKEPQKGDTIATITTNLGELKMLLYTEKAPITTKNFIELTKQGKYKDVPFHRVIEDFMIQGGDFERKNGTGGYSFEGPGTNIPDEFDEELKHAYGAVSMANAGPNTGGSQFFIVQAPLGTPWLDGRHAVFGYIYKGMDLVDKIAVVETDAMDRPKEEILIEEISIDEY